MSTSTLPALPFPPEGLRRRSAVTEHTLRLGHRAHRRYTVSGCDWRVLVPRSERAGRRPGTEGTQATKGKASP